MREERWLRDSQPAAAPSGPSPQGKRSRRKVAAAALIVLLAAGAGGGFAISRSNEGDSRSKATTTAAASTPGAPPQHQNGPAINAVLREYAAQYSNEDVRGLSALFAPTVFRSAGGADRTEGRNAVAQVYRRQFEEVAEPRYSLYDVRLDANPANPAAAATYTIKAADAADARGRILFRFEADATDPLITEIVIDPTPPGAPQPTACNDVIVTPNSDNALSRLDVGGAGCGEVEDELRTWGQNGYSPQSGPPGYRCVEVHRYAAGNGRVRCRRGSAIANFDTGI